MPSADNDVDMRGGGTASVDAPGAAAQDIYVGPVGNNTLRVENAGTLAASGTLMLGYLPGSSGTVIVDGDGSSVTVGIGTVLGHQDGAGRLIVENGGSFATQLLYAAGGLGSGSISVSGRGSSVAVQAFAQFGAIGGAPWELNVADEGRFSADTLHLNADTAINVSNGGVLDIADIYTNAGRATFDVSTTGSDTFRSDIKENGGTNTLKKSGSGILVLTGDSQFSGGVTVADGELRIGDGGMASFAASSVDLSGATSQLTINSDADLALATPFNGVGKLAKLGAGTLTLSGDSLGFSGSLAVAGGSLDLTGRLGSTGAAIDGAGGGEATMRVVGSAADWTNYGGVNVGELGSGMLEISGGGKVSNSEAFVGVHSASSGEVTVSGRGSTWSAGELTVGQSGKGTLTIEDGGVVNTAYSHLGYDIGGTGAVSVSGAGSTWSNSGYLAVGYSSTGGLIIEDGGSVSNNYGYIGFGTGSSGAVTISGAGSTWTTSGSLFAGSFGSGALTIEDGGSVSSDFGYIGFGTGGTGVTTVSGAGSKWSAGELSVGYSGTGTLTVAEGGVVSVGAGAGAFVLTDDQAGGRGTLNIGSASGETAVAAGTLEAGELRFGNGSGTLVFNHTGLAGGSALDFTPGIAGQGAILQENGNTILSGNGAGFTGTTEVAGGALTIADQLGGSALIRGGRLEVEGSFDGDVAVSGPGTVTGSGAIAGNASLSGGGVLEGRQGQSLAIGGNLTLGADSAINVALGSASSAALFEVGGNLTLDGTLNVSDRGGFGAGVYRLFDYSGLLIDNGLAIGGVPQGVSSDSLAIQTAHPGSVNLISTAGAELRFWDGGSAALYDNGSIDGGAGTWRAGGRSWTNAEGSSNGFYHPNPAFAVFQGSAGTVAVDGRDGAIGVTGMQFVSDGYRIESGAIALEGTGGESIVRVGDGTQAGFGVSATIASDLTGNSSLVKADNGTLILSGNNSYTGGTELRGGMLEIASDGALGAKGGDIVFSGGVLSATADLTSARDISIVGSTNAAFAVTRDTEATFSGTITGKTDLVKSGEGTLVLTGANDYRETFVRDGTLVGSTGSIKGNLANAATAVFDQRSDAHFAGDVAGFSGTNGGMIKRGAATLTLDGVSTLDWSVEEGGLVSASNRFGGDLDLAAGALFTFDQSYDGAYGGAISGSGNLGFTGGGKVELRGDNSRFGGMTEVADTTLIVNEALGGSALIGAGGRLQGSGVIGSGWGSTVTLASGSTLAPGNSIGTMTVDGDLILDYGSRYNVEVAPGGSESDLIKVTGSATLNGGTVAHIGMTGTYDPSATYTILSADDGLRGTFDSVTSDFAFLDPTLGYGGHDVTLTLARNDIDFARAAETRNQVATAGGVDSLSLGNDLYDAVVQLDEATARSAFDQLSGEIHASAVMGLIEDSRHIRNAANDRLRSAFEGVGSSTVPVMIYGSEGVAAAPAANRSGISVWGAGFGSWGSADDDGNAAGVDRSTGGFVGGADAMVTDAWRVGLLAGYSHSSFSAHDRASSASSDGYHVGLYAGARWEALSFRSGLAYSLNDLETDRAVGFAGFADSLSASYDATTLQAFGELGYGIETSVVRFEPFVNLAHVSVRTDGYSERGGTAALISSGQTIDATFTTVGLHTQTDVTIKGTELSLTGLLGWRRVFGDTTPTATHALAGSNAFTIAGNPIAKDAAVIGVGIDFDIASRTNFAIAYQGQFGDGAEDQGFNAKLGIRF